MSNKPDSLDEAYQQFKRQHKVPTSVRRAVINKATSEQNKEANKLWRQWALAGSTGFALLVFVFMWMSGQYISQYPESQLVVTNIQMHGFNPEPQDTQLAIQQQKATYFADYQQRELIVLNRYQQDALVVEAGGEYALTTCQKDLIRLSAGLVSRLIAEQRFTPALKAGDSVAIAFNQDGYILSISKANKPLQC